MAEVAYELERFLPTEKKPVVRKAPPVPKKHSAFRQQLFKMARTLLAAMVMVVLVSGVLYTQTTVAELQSQIESANKNLVEAEAQYAYLNESMANIHDIERRATELGLVPLEPSQVTYVRAEEDKGIEVKEGLLGRWLEKLKEWAQDVWDHISP